MGARHPEEGGEWRSPLKRGHPEEGDRPVVEDASVRLRYTEGGLRAEERRGRGVQSGCTASGGRRFGGFGAKPSPISGKRKASATTSEGAEKDGAHGPASTWALRFGGLGLKTTAHLLWAGRSLDKIDDINISGGTWQISCGCVGSKQPLEATGAVG